MLTRLGPVHKPQHRIWSSSVTCCFSLSLHFLSSLWTGSQKYRTSMAKVAPSVPSPISRLAPPTIVLQDMEEESDEDRWVIWVPEEVLRFFMRSNRSLKRLTWCPWGRTVDVKGSRSANGSLMHPWRGSRRSKGPLKVFYVSISMFNGSMDVKGSSGPWEVQCIFGEVQGRTTMGQHGCLWSFGAVLWIFLLLE